MMDPDSTTILWLFAGAFVIAGFAAGLSLRRWVYQTSQDPLVILHRCRVELIAVQVELEQLPATHEIHATLQQLREVHHTIDREEQRLKEEAKAA